MLGTAQDRRGGSSHFLPQKYGESVRSFEHWTSGIKSSSASSTHQFTHTIAKTKRLLARD
jgi:hypothetical protein